MPLQRFNEDREKGNDCDCLNEGKIMLARIDESYVRIVKCKERLGNIQEGRRTSLVSERNRPSARSTGR